jgi:hypothetical protein
MIEVQILMALLFSVIPEAREVLSLEPEDLSGILLEVVPRVPEAPRFLISSFTQGEAPYNREYPQAAKAAADSLDKGLTRIKRAFVKHRGRNFIPTYRPRWEDDPTA